MTLTKTTKKSPIYDALPKIFKLTAFNMKKVDKFSSIVIFLDESC